MDKLLNVAYDILLLGTTFISFTSSMVLIGVTVWSALVDQVEMLTPIVALMLFMLGMLSSWFYLKIKSLTNLRETPPP